MEFEAAILTEQNKPLIVDYIKCLNDELGIGQVLVELYVSGICGSQLGEIDGVKGSDKFIPHLMGHEGCGRVKELGPGVTTVKVGDKVVLHWKKGNGINSEVPKYEWKGKLVNAGWVTTFNKYAVVSENRMTSIPEEIPSDEAALFGCAVTTGFGVVENNAQLKIGESIVVLGAGGIGLNIIQAANLVSAYPIIAVDLYSDRLELAKKVGATHLINTMETDFSDKILSIVGNDLDVFVDNTGLPEIIEKGYKLINDLGRLILVGVPRKGQNINIFSLPLHFGKKIIGSFGGECKPEIDIPRYLKLYQREKLSLNQIITERYKLKDINLAISRIREGKAIGRVMIDFE
tara:strand:- start:3978 stop:5018 length:1041 start_codon:yes stop_codon:yes gene_type:complete